MRLSQVAMEDYRQAEWDPSVRMLLDFAVQVTRDPHAGGDAVILEAVEVIGFFTYYNRLADALGVEPEPEWGAESPEESDSAPT